MFSFFNKHRRTSGVISILLTLMLLPVYSLVAVLVESARIQEAREQLNELTYLGEMAILADYIDYLNDNYDIYAFDGTTAEESFKQYVQSAESNGGIDTRKLNKLFGIDMQYCSIENMYSLADTTVLRYQIVQSGRYSMPVEILSGFTFKTLFGSLDEKLGKVKKVFDKIEKVSETANNLVGLVTAAINVCTAIDKLETALNKYSQSHSAFVSVKTEIGSRLTSLINSYSDSEFETNFNMLYKNGDKTGNVALVDDDEEFLEAFLNFYDSVDSSYFLPDESGNSTLVNEITLTDKQAEALNNIGLRKGLYKYAVGDNMVVSSITNDFFHSLQTRTSFYISRYNIDNPNVLWGTQQQINQTVNNLRNYTDKLENFRTAAEKFSGVMNSEAINKYAELDKKAKELETKYSDYCTAMVALITAVGSAVDSMKDLQNIENEIKQEAVGDAIVQTNNQTNVANKERIAYESMTEAERNTPAGREQKKRMNQEARKRLAAYHNMKNEAADINDYVDIGKSVLVTFVAEFSDNRLEKWKTSLENNMARIHNADISNLNSGVSANEFKIAAQRFINLNLSAVTTDNVVQKFEGNGLEALFSNQQTPEKLNDEIKKTQENLDKEEFEEVDSVFESGDINEYYYNLFRDGVVNLFNPEPGDEANFQTAYYISKNTAMAIELFMVAVGKVDEVTQDIWDKISTILKLIFSILPADPFLNNIVGGTQDFIDPANPIKDSLEQVTRKSYAQTYVAGFLGTGFASSDYYVGGYATSEAQGVFDQSEAYLSSGIGKIQNSVFTMCEKAKDIVNELVHFKIISLVFSVIKFFGAIVEFVGGIIDTIIGLVTFVGAAIQNPEMAIAYIIDGLYLSYYTTKHFESRQNYSSVTVGDAVEFIVGGKESSTNAAAFDGADLEYFFAGSNDEIENQKKAYYGIFVLRLIFNIPTILENAAIRSASNAIPYVGWIIVPILADLVESKLDMALMIIGYKVDFIKSEINLMDMTMWESLFDYITNMDKNKKEIGYKMVNGATRTGESNPSKMRKYELKDADGSGAAAKEKFQNAAGVGGKTKFNSAFIAIRDGKICADYNGYINVLSIFLPVGLKTARIGNLIQMHYREDKKADFKMSDSYTYIGVNYGSGNNGAVHYSSWLPLYMDDPDSKYKFYLLPPLQEVQYNGY